MQQPAWYQDVTRTHPGPRSNPSPGQPACSAGKNFKKPERPEWNGQNGRPFWPFWCHSGSTRWPFHSGHSGHSGSMRWPFWPFHSGHSGHSGGPFWPFWGSILASGGTHPPPPLFQAPQPPQCAPDGCPATVRCDGRLSSTHKQQKDTVRGNYVRRRRLARRPCNCNPLSRASRFKAWVIPWEGRLAGCNLPP